MSTRLKFFLIMVLAVLAAILSYPREGQILKLVGLKSNLKIQEGLDLKGGAQLVFQADLAKTASKDRDNAMSSLIQVIQRRANPAGTSEVAVTRQGNDRVVVELPGVSDVTEAIDRIGKTAELTFLQLAGGATTANYQETGVTGKDIDRADVDYDTTRNQPIVTLTLKSGDSTKRFGELTTRLNQTSGQLVTMLDQDIIFGPATVSSPITDGKAQLQGNFRDVRAAKKVADEINAGALPVPVALVSQRTVGPTLGRDSLNRSVVAGIIGLTVVAIFMIAYYRLAGLLAVAALAIYTLLTLAIYKLSGLLPATIVLTLAGIAGFILSIGMAVDANILIFERMKEEIRAGKTFVNAIETAFDRAWTSIRDSNMSTLITCVILYVFSGATPIIKGFAITLGLGVIISMFTAVVVSRTFLRMIVRTRIGRNPKWYGFKPVEVKS